jgi:hypothetical protein
MSVADAQRPSTTENPVVPVRPVGAAEYRGQAPPPPAPRSSAPAAPWAPPGRRQAVRKDGLGRDQGRLLAGAFAVAWILCPAVEPMPAHDVEYPLWQLPIELATLATIVAAVIALWRGHRNSAHVGMAAGVFMAIMTMVCPLAGHTPVGWWTWLQTGLSLFVMATSAVLLRLRPAAGDRT